MRLSPCIRITRPAALLAVVIGLFLPAAVASAAPTHPPDSTEAARAVARDAALSGTDSRAARPDRADAARAVGRYYASFGDEQPIAPPAVAARPVPVPAPAEPDGPTWAAALIAGVLAAVAAAGLGVIAGRRTVRVRHG